MTKHETALNLIVEELLRMKSKMVKDDLLSQNTSSRSQVAASCKPEYDTETFTTRRRA